MFGHNSYLYTENGLRKLPTLFSEHKAVTVWNGEEEVSISPVFSSVDTQAVRIFLSNGMNIIAHVNQEVKTLQGFYKARYLQKGSKLKINMSEGLFGPDNPMHTAYNYGVLCNLGLRIPPRIFNSNRTSVIEFLRGVLDSKQDKDYYATLKGYRPVIEQLWLFFNNLGIQTQIDKTELKVPWLTSIHRLDEIFQYNRTRGIRIRRENYVTRLNPFVTVRNVTEAFPKSMFTFYQPEGDNTVCVNGVVFRMRPHSGVR